MRFQPQYYVKVTIQDHHILKLSGEISVKDLSQSRWERKWKGSLYEKPSHLISLLANVLSHAMIQTSILFGLFHLVSRSLISVMHFCNCLASSISPRVRIVIDMPCINRKLQFRIQFLLPFCDMNPASLKFQLKRIFKRGSNKK